MALNRSDKSRILRRYFPGMTRNSEMSTEPSKTVEEAVKYVEEAMGLSLPTSHVIVLLDDTGVIADFAGVNYGQAIAYLRKGEDGTDWDRAGFRKGMVHEVAHYFWRGNEDWIDEGITNTIGYNFARDKGLPPQMMGAEQRGCTIKTLEKPVPDKA